MKKPRSGEGLTSYQAMNKYCRRCPYLLTCAKPCETVIFAVTPKEEEENENQNDRKQ